LFEKGSYQPLPVEGDRSEHLFAFARVLEDRYCIVALPHWCARLMHGACEAPIGAVWGSAKIEVNLPVVHSLRELFSGRTINVQRQGDTFTLSAAELFSEFPLAVLVAP
jgi:(1->4)-alpha-D-glucan 1-alpha-D-glucosylmutase